jgi:hypothetical protein
LHARLLNLLTLELVREVRPFRFGFINVARLFCKFKGNADFIAVLSGAAKGCPKKCQKECLSSLGKCSDWPKLMELASFEEDCEESERLAEELQKAASG